MTVNVVIQDLIQVRNDKTGDQGCFAFGSRPIR